MLSEGPTDAATTPSVRADGRLNPPRPLHTQHAAGGSQGQQPTPRADDAPGSDHSADTWRRLQRHAADTLYALLLLALVLTAGWLIARHDHYFDWTSSGRNSLSPQSIAVLERLPVDDAQPLGITIFAPREHRIGRAVEQLVARYQQQRPDLDVHWVDPQRFPERARDADVRLLGQIVLEYRGRRESLGVLSEAALSSAIARLTLARAPLVALLEGHGERALGGAGPDLGRFAQLLRQRGFRLQPLDLAGSTRVPDNTDLLLISMPAIDLFPGEAEALVDYVAAGGHLLWLMEPGDSATLKGLEPLAAYLGIRALPGTVVDAAAAAHGFATPVFAVVSDWPDHPLGRDLVAPAVLPGSSAFAVSAAPGWQIEATLSTGTESWNETGPIRGELTLDANAGEEAGPLAVAMVLSRPSPGAAAAQQPDALTQAPVAAETALAAVPQQRVIVVGDGDFASNAHLASAENRTLALRMARWLTGLEDLITPPGGRDDRDNFALSTPRAWLISVGAVVLLPALLIAAGVLLRWRRERA
jgi:hypothetical protein